MMNTNNDWDFFGSGTEYDEGEDENGEKPIGTCNQIDCFKYKNPKLPLNSAVQPLRWSIRLKTEETIHEGGNINCWSIVPFDYFLHSSLMSKQGI